MAAMNGSQFVSCMIRRKDRLDFASTLGDPCQWPTLGQSSDTEQKKKLIPLGNSSSNSTGKAASSSRIKSESTSERTSLVQPAALASSHILPSDHNIPAQLQAETWESPESTSSYEDGEEGTQRRNSGDFSTRKKVVKTKWIPLEIPVPTSRMVLQDKLRIRRQETFGAAYRPDYGRFRSAPNGAPVTHQTTQSVKASMVATSANGSNFNNYNQSNVVNAPTTNSSSSASNQPYRNNSNSQMEQNRRTFKKPPPPPPPFNGSLNRPRIARKMQGFRQRDMTYDGDYMGRDGDGHSDGADDGSQHENGDYDSQGYYNDSYNGDSWSADWSSSMYYDYGVDGGYSQGYNMGGGDEYSDGYAYYTATGEMDGGGLDENGLYIPPSPMPAYLAPSVDVELKKTIKYQIEYYFSPDNLQKDFFLRRMMAKDGSVMLGLVASFQRVRALSQDFNMIMESIVDSDQVELLDNFMVRPRETPELWPIEEEDEKNTGYYYINGETDDYSIYPNSGSGTFDETDESGTGEDVSYPDDDEEDDEEEVSMDGSDLSEDLCQLSKLKPDVHHLDNLQAMSEKFLQQVM